jgi:hypothetical protein
LTKFYIDNDHLDTFEVEIKVDHNKDYQDEFADEIAEKGDWKPFMGKS